MKARWTLCLLSLTLVSCASKQKIAFQAIEPAQEHQVASIRTVAFDTFEKDRIGVSGVIEGALGGYSLDGKKPYFQVVERKNLANILAEQQLSSSWAVDPEQRIKVGKLVGAQGIFSGEVVSVTSSDAYRNESRSRCAYHNKKGGCERYEEYTVSCQEKTYGVSILVKLVDTATGNYVFSNTFTESESYSKCPDGGSIPGGSEVLSSMLRKISKDLIAKVAPTKYVLEVALLDEIDDDNVETSGKQEELFKSAFEFAKAGRVDKSLERFQKFGESVSWKSYVANYNYAVLLEAHGDLAEAEKYYKAADEIAVKPVPEINDGVKRIAARLEKGRQLASQLKERE